MERSEIIQLFQKYLDNRHSQAELMTLLRYFEQQKDNDIMLNLIRAEFQQHTMDGIEAGQTDAILAVVDESLSKKIRKRRLGHLLNRSWVVAASLLAVFTIGVYFYYIRAQREDIKPGGNRATLTLNNGTILNLDSSQRGIVMGKEGIRYQSGKLVDKDPASSLILSTPRGGQYMVILSDGTNVWLNAESTLKYPSKFSDGKREVFLDGEAYFQIKENKTKPFKVLSRNQELLVLGTAFNISSYENETFVRTTLVTGAVQVSARNMVNSKRLQPGQQAVLKNNQLEVENVDLESAIAWRNNKFSFDNKPFTQIMDEMSRWYNVDVTYEGPVPNSHLVGDAFRTNKFSTVLQFLENLGLDYRIETNTNHGHRLIIINKQGGKS